MRPIYERNHTCVSDDLRWSLTITPDGPTTPPTQWSDRLRSLLIGDAIHLLDVHQPHAGTLRFDVSTPPDVAPADIVWICRGALQDSLRTRKKLQLRRKFLLASVGDGSTDAGDRFIAGRLERRSTSGTSGHRGIRRPTPRRIDHGVHDITLRMAAVHDKRFRTMRADHREVTVRAVIDTAAKYDHDVLSLIAAPDHLWLCVDVPAERSPGEVALSYLNNVAFRHGSRPVFERGCHLETVSSTQVGV